MFCHVTCSLKTNKTLYDFKGLSIYSINVNFNNQAVNHFMYVCQMMCVSDDISHAKTYDINIIHKIYFKVKAQIETLTSTYNNPIRFLMLGI